MLAATAADRACASELAQRLGLPLLASGIDPVQCNEAGAVLLVDGYHRSVLRTGKGAPGAVAVDFGNPAMRHRRASGQREMLGRAVGQGKKSPLLILDATAGLGRDAFVLADLGCDVILCERQPVIAELLRAGLQVAAHSGDAWLISVVQRMQLCQGDARQPGAGQIVGIDVIYLDPMFPPRSKSAAVKKEMALFQHLLEDVTDPYDADALLQWALQQAAARVVVKRPARAPALAALQPSHCIVGKSVRYDVYVRRKLV